MEFQGPTPTRLTHAWRVYATHLVLCCDVLAAGLPAQGQGSGGGGTADASKYEVSSSANRSVVIVPVYCSSGKIAEATVGRSSSNVALMSSPVNSRGVSDPTCSTPITLPPAIKGTPIRVRIPLAHRIGLSTVV